MTIVYIVFAIIIFVPVIGINIVSAINDHEYTVTVTDKDRIVNGGSSKYLVYTEDMHGNTIVFENVDSNIRFKYNSSDIQGQLKIGHTYRLTVVGYRIPFLSMYENIIKIQEVYDE